MNDLRSTVQYSVDRGIGWIRLNRPDRLNAVIPALVEDLCETLEQAITDDLSAAIITGNGRAFCAGFDLKEERSSLTQAAHRRQIDRVHDVTRLIRRAPLPVIAAVNGYAIGNGAEFALAADVVIAAEDAQFRCPEVQWGLSVTGGVTELLVRTAGPYRAKKIVLFGEAFSAQQAFDWGLVTSVVATGQLEAEALRVAKLLSEMPAEALIRAKRALDLATAAGLESAMAIETEHALASRDSAESRRAVKRFNHDTE